MKKPLLSKTSYIRYVNKHRSDSNVWLVFIVSVVVLFLFWWRPLFLLPLTDKLLTPIYWVDSFFKNSSSFLPTLLRDRKSLELEIKYLNDKLATMENDKDVKNKLLQENRELRKLLRLVDKTRVVAAVVARPDKLPFDFVQIDKGRKSGIKVGAPVFVGDSTVIGLVSKVGEDYSFVKLVSTPGFKATVFVLGPNVIAEFEGWGGGVSRVKVPQGIDLQKGNLVYLPGVDTGLLGSIVSVSEDVTQSEKYGFMVFNTPLSGLFWVTVGDPLPIIDDTEELEAKVMNNINDILHLDSISPGTVATTTATSSATSSTTISTSTIISTFDTATGSSNSRLLEPLGDNETIGENL